MDKELKYRKELLIRKNRCKEFHGKYLMKISNLFLVDTTEIKFLSLEESDLIKKKDINHKICNKRYIASNKSDLNSLTELLKNTKGSYYVFIDHDWEYCGCFIINSLDIINENFMFEDYVTDDIVFIENSFLSKIRLDYYEMNNEFYIDYEIYNDLFV
jgi:hypothetical protein